MKTWHWIGALALSVSFVASANAQRNLGDTYKDSDYGYSLKIPAKWKQVPVPPDKKNVIAMFTGPDIDVNKIKNDDPKVRYIATPSLAIVRILPKQAKSGPGEKQPEAADTSDDENPEDGEKPATPEDLRKKLEELERKKVPHSFDEWLKKYSGESGVKFDGQPKKMKVGKFDVTQYSYWVKGPLQIDLKNHALVYHLGTEDYAICYTLIDIPNGYPKYDEMFNESTRTFRPPDKKTSEAADAKRKEPIASIANSKEMRKRLEEEVSKTAGWYLEETKHYFIAAQEKDSRYIKKFAEKLEAIRSKLEADFPPEKPITQMGLVRVCHGRLEASSYVGTKVNPLGFWNPDNKELFTVVDPESQGLGELTMFAYLYREAFAQYMYLRNGEIPFHFWILRGLGEYYGGAKEAGGKITEIAPNNVPLYSGAGQNDPGRQETIKRVIRDEKFIPLDRFVRLAREEYNQNGAEKLAQGWGLIFFLREGKGAQGWNKDWEKIIPTYIKVVVETRDPNRAVEEAFKGVDYSALESSMVNFIK